MALLSLLGTQKIAGKGDGVIPELMSHQWERIHTDPTPRSLALERGTERLNAKWIINFLFYKETSFNRYCIIIE
ncbi:hypothetical protein NPIL_188471 [Nephila pilipes]|uniref:Uncharacterized protein n=1 Tax=Nephila pilipes TaxID=299642 RepID=A0A8X6PN71_NEPPI|nr:hypothetical protein NPIL_188471 [Nephila pilipes]